MKKEVIEMYHKAKELLDPKTVSPVGKLPSNGFHVFYISPSGSKVGWETYTMHEMNVDAFIRSIPEDVLAIETDYLETKATPRARTINNTFVSA